MMDVISEMFNKVSDGGLSGMMGPLAAAAGVFAAMSALPIPTWTTLAASVVSALALGPKVGDMFGIDGPEPELAVG